MTDMTIFAINPPDSPDGMKDFLLANSMDHAQIAQALEQRLVSIDVYPLADMKDEQDWLELHSQVHEQELNALGINQDVDLSQVDFHDESQYYDWHWQHGLIHQYVKQALGL
jgi:hypothetical protein